MDYNQQHEYLGKTLTNIIRVMQNILFATSPYRTIIKPEILGYPLSKWLVSSQISVNESPMVFLFISSVNIYFCCHYIFIKD